MDTVTHHLEVIRNLLKSNGGPRHDMTLSEAVKKQVHPLLDETAGPVKEQLLELMEQADLLHEYRTDVAVIGELETKDAFREQIISHMFDLLQAIKGAE
ncbi:hypothetical protein LSG31_17545 [Fodinisporobacter ferrooxydans]|uniref:Uncharacterized protein n=1 Tax=Fodinisporobacter ferrooxydans TaxID=2901836 RepID=A0ABY4CGL4_9BACL|nr:hypothetical protein LSG31_17545 [Alicyclobacillaceae bacterium MYW30-H2]